jgi:hypothetical protein
MYSGQYGTRGVNLNHIIRFYCSSPGCVTILLSDQDLPDLKLSEEDSSRFIEFIEAHNKFKLGDI